MFVCPSHVCCSSFPRIDNVMQDNTGSSVSSVGALKDLMLRFSITFYVSSFGQNSSLKHNRVPTKSIFILLWKRLVFNYTSHNWVAAFSLYIYIYIYIYITASGFRKVDVFAQEICAHPVLFTIYHTAYSRAI